MRVAPKIKIALRTISGEIFRVISLAKYFLKTKSAEEKRRMKTNKMGMLISAPFTTARKTFCSWFFPGENKLANV